MYEAFFRLSKRPFAAVPRVDQYYPAAAIEAARRTLGRCVQRAEGPGLVVGPSGTGKTLLCNLLAEQFRSQFHVVTLSSGRLSTRRALFQAILYGLGQPYRGMDEGELRLALTDYLATPAKSSAGMVLLVDEAHTLPLRLLDEIRMITNLVCEGQPRTRLVLVGGPALEERFASPKLDSFSQRLVARCYLEAFSRPETEEYIASQLQRAGGRSGEIFSAEACRSVHQATDGVPRLVNHVCDHALVLAYAAGRPAIEPATVEEAWADLQQLPTPWNEEGRQGKSGGKSAGNVVEFGRLEEESEESPGPAPATDAVPGAVTVPSADAASIADAVPIAETDLVTDAAETSAEVLHEDGPSRPEPEEQVERIESLISDLKEASNLEEAADDFQPAGSAGPEIELVFDEPGSPFAGPFAEEEIVVDRFAAATGSRRPQIVPFGAVGESPFGERGLPSPGPETVPLRPQSSWEDLAPAEASVAAEDGYGPAEAPREPCVVGGRKREYRQLFTRLRRGLATGT